jgi:predicted nucleotidyltransferase
VPRQETPTEHLRALARHITAILVEEVAPRSVLLTGSTATGEADYHSDLDLIVYCDELPAAERIGSVIDRLGGEDRKLIYPRTEDEHGEAFELGRLQCQLAFVTVRCADGEVGRVLAGEELESPLQKAVEGIQDGIPLHGPELIERWRVRVADYPDSLRCAMIERHWRFFPLWYVDRQMAARDALLWRQEILVDAAFDLLAVLAALNRLYFTRFQLKRMRKLVARMRLAPPDLADRLERLFEVDDAAAELERLVAETQTLVGAELPDLELRLRQPIGARRDPWDSDEELGVELRPPLRAFADEADDGATDLDR